MDDFGWWNEPLNQTMHAVPPHRAFLAASGHCAVPVAAHFIAKPPDGPPIARDTVVPAMAAYHRSQPFAHLGYRVVPAPQQLSFDFPELGPQAITRCVPMHPELSSPGP